MNKIQLLVISILFLPAYTAYGSNGFVQVDDYPRDVSLDPLTGNLYTANYNSGTISVIDYNQMQLINTIDIPDAHPVKIIVDPSQSRLFISDKISGDLIVIDAMTNKIIDRLHVGSSLWDLELEQKTGKLYISELVDKQIIVLDAQSLEHITTIDIAVNPWDFVINQKTNTLYLVDGTNPVIHVIDTINDEKTIEIRTEIKPWSISVNESTNILYISSWDSSKILSIQEQTFDVVSEITILPGSFNIETNQSTGITLVSNEHTHEIYVIDQNSELIHTVSTPSSPHAMAYHPFSNIVYVLSPIGDEIFSVSYPYQTSTINEFTDHDFDAESYSELVQETAKGITQIQQRQNIDEKLISDLLQNIGITGDFDGNAVAKILLDDYNKNKENQPKSVSVPQWTKELAQSIDPTLDLQHTADSIDCTKQNFEFNWDEFDPFETWLSMLPICALS